MSGNWWVNKSGQNMLSQLSDEVILDFLFRYPKARTAFNQIVPTMDEDERERLQALIDSSPGIKKKQMRDPRDVADSLQSKWNKSGVFRTNRRRKK